MQESAAAAFLEGKGLRHRERARTCTFGAVSLEMMGRVTLSCRGIHMVYPILSVGVALLNGERTKTVVTVVFGRTKSVYILSTGYHEPKPAL